jgi:PAS domain S-box-containing protein
MVVRKRLIFLLLVVLVPLLLFEIFIFYRWYEDRKEAQIQANLELARAVGKTFERFVKDVLHQQLAIGLALTSSQELSLEHRDRILLRSHADNPGIWQLFWSSPSGVVLSATGSQFIGMRIDNRDYFKQIVAGQDYVISDLLLSRTTGKPSFTISRGIRNEKDVLLGIIIAGILPERLDEELGVKRFTGGGLAFIDRKGMLVYHYPAIEATWEERNWLKQYPEFEDVFKGKEVSATVYAPYEGKKRLVSFTPASSIGWAATAGVREEGVVNPILLDISKNGALFLFVSILGFLIALALSRTISSPIAALRNFALALGRGGENRQPPPTQKIPEFQDLADAFNSMAEKVQEREMALRESEEKYRTTLASVGDAVISSDLSGNISFMNKIAEELTGWTFSEASTKPVADVFHIINEHSRNRVEDPVAKVLKEGVIVGLENHTVLVSKSGREIPIDDSGAPIRDHEGSIMGVVLIFRNITERKRAEVLLQRQAELLFLSYDAIIVWQLGGRIENWNKGAEELYGYSKEEAVGQVTHDLLKTIHSEPWSQIEAKLRERKFWEGELKHRTRDGREIIVSARHQLIQDADGVERILETNRDITGRKRMEEVLRLRALELQHLTETLEERVKERTTKLANLSSELLVAQEKERKRISYNLHVNVWQELEIIKTQLDNLFSRESEADWAALHRKAKQLTPVIRDTIARIRLMQGDLWPSVLDDIGIVATLEWYCREFGKNHPGLGIEKNVGLGEEEIPASAKIVIYRVMQEALSNVAKHSQAIHVSLSLVKSDHRLEFFIKDDGVGFDPEEVMIKRIPWGGLGLLSLKERTELSGGLFRVESAKGKGTTIRASWPFIENG